MLRKRFFPPDITYGCDIAEDKDKKQKYSSFSDEEDFCTETESPPKKLETSLLGPWTSNSSDSSELPDLKLPISIAKVNIFYLSMTIYFNISLINHLKNKSIFQY